MEGLVSRENSFRQQFRRCLRKYNPSAILDRKKEQDPTGSWSVLISRVVISKGCVVIWLKIIRFVGFYFMSVKSCILCYFYLQYYTVFRILLLWLFWNGMNNLFEV